MDANATMGDPSSCQRKLSARVTILLHVPYHRPRIGRVRHIYLMSDEFIHDVLRLAERRVGVDAKIKSGGAN